MQIAAGVNVFLAVVVPKANYTAAFSASSITVVDSINDVVSLSYILDSAIPAGSVIGRVVADVRSAFFTLSTIALPVGRPIVSRVSPALVPMSTGAIVSIELSNMIGV